MASPLKLIPEKWQKHSLDCTKCIICQRHTTDNVSVVSQMEYWHCKMQPDFLSFYRTYTCKWNIPFIKLEEMGTQNRYQVLVYNKW